MSERIAEVIHEKSNELIAKVIPLLPPTEDTTADDTHQFIAGFVQMMADAARGNFELREQYWEGVIPAIKAGGMPLEPVMSGMVRLSMAIAWFFADDEEVVRWTLDFCSDHSTQLAKVYSE